MPMSPRLLRPRASGFNPKSIGSLSLWLDANDSSTTIIDTGVTTWQDKSGNGRNFTQTVGNSQPLIGTLNGRRALSFDGVNDRLQRASVNNGDFVSATGGAVFVVMSPVNSVDYNVFYNGGAIVQRDRFNGDSNSYASTLRATRFEGVANNVMPTNSSAIYTHHANATTHAMRINRVQRFSGSSDIAAYRATTGRTWQIGNGPEVGTWFAGAIGEILFYSVPLSATQIATVEQYLKSKWGTP